MSTMELLAPAGNVETFLAALAAGADAVYVGAPGFNARNLARDIRLEEIGAMIEYCHSRGRKLYLAFNSLLLENELGRVVETFALLEELKPDALIVQDYALLSLVRNYFPKLTVHGSTLMTATNSDAVNFLAKMGCERVVLARELTLKEIVTINSHRHETELEVFIHGAMCFSYSGLCLFSSYLGGKSGLRGRCVQPCRRNYSSEKAGNRGGKTGSGGARYLFSMNDLSGLEVIPELRELQIASLKIEGRLRTAHYIRNVVSAYRMAIDASPESWDTALNEAKALVDSSMSRKTSPGYFFSPQPASAITAHHSGNMGMHLGRFTAVKKVGKVNVCRFILKHDLTVGDRLRLHAEPSGERTPFTLKSMNVDGQERGHALAGVRVSLALPDGFVPPSNGHVEVYKVDVASSALDDDEVDRLTTGYKNRIVQLKRDNRRHIEVITAEVDVNPAEVQRDAQSVSAQTATGRAVTQGWPELWLRVDAVRLLQNNTLNFPFARYVLVANDRNIKDAAVVKRMLGKGARQLVWALPPVILVNELERWRKKTQGLIRTGFRNFQIGHLSQVELFAGEKVALFGDYSLNILNSQAAELVLESGLSYLQCSIEMDRQALGGLLQGVRTKFALQSGTGRKKNVALGLTVYGAPALYTARLAADHFRYEQEVLSPKNESYVVVKKEGGTQTYPMRPFSLLQFLPELRSLGIDYGVVDISGRKFSKRELDELVMRLRGKGSYAKLPTFNYLGKLI